MKWDCRRCFKRRFEKVVIHSGVADNELVCSECVKPEDVLLIFPAVVGVSHKVMIASPEGKRRYKPSSSKIAAQRERRRRKRNGTYVPMKRSDP